jgi:transcriptional regulator GlxA family with amidase domain
VGALDHLLSVHAIAAAGRDPVVDAALATLARSGGAMAVRDLAARAGLSTRQLERRFRRQVGLPPKPMAGIMRLQQAFTLLAAGSAPPLTEVAHRCGYFDQSHFIRDFRRVAGLPPSRFLHDDGAMARLFVAP